MRKILTSALLVLMPWILSASDLIVKSAVQGVDDTVKKIENIIASQKGLSIFTIIDHKKAADKIGMQLSETKVIVFGNPKMGTKFMQKNHLTALDLPLKILVYSENGSTKIVYRSPKAWAHGFALDGFKLLDKMSNALDKITTKASK